MRQQDPFKLPSKPWKAGRLIGPKAPLKPKHVRAIRQQLKTTKRVRDLTLFNCALDAKLRACDLVKVQVRDVAPRGSLRQRSTVTQQKTSRPAPFEITEPPGRLWHRGWACGGDGPTIGFSQVGAGKASTLAPASMLAWSTSG